MMNHSERVQAVRDFKTLHKAHAILHDPERKRNAHRIAEEKNEALKPIMVPMPGENEN